MRSSTEGRGAAAWVAVALLLAVPSLAVGTGKGMGWDVLSWQPGLAASEPWRWWSAAWVHLSLRHLLANLVGVALIVTLGLVARVHPRAALAWALAWPLTHGLLWFQPELLRYGGMSGVLHAGVAIGAVAAWTQAPNRRARWVAVAIGAGVMLKIWSEKPWAHVLTHPPGWDIAVAPGAHASGACAGLLLALVLLQPWRSTVRKI